MKILAKKGSNSFQERVFSRCSYLADMHRQRLGKEKFEWQVLLAVNHDFLLQERKLQEDMVKDIESSTKDDNSLREHVRKLLKLTDDEVRKDFPLDPSDETNEDETVPKADNTDSDDEDDD